MCCCISGDPVEDSKGRIKSFHPQGREQFQTGMMNAPCVACPSSCCWCLGQFFPLTMGCTQCQLRKKVLDNDMSKYQCFQGYYTICCCIKGGSCHEDSCPDLCAFLEGCFCNCVAISASRVYTMEKYNLASEACDYRLIRINNCLQMLACVCYVLSIIDGSFRDLAQIIDLIADLFYHTISGCMTAQVAHEINYQKENPNAPNKAAVPGGPPPTMSQQVAPVYAQQPVQPGYPQQGYPQQGVPGQQPVVYVQQQPVYATAVPAQQYQQ